MAEALLVERLMALLVQRLRAPGVTHKPGPNGGVVMAARTRYAPDRGLTVRMTATMFLLGLVFVAFVAAIIGIGTAYHASSAAIVLFAVVLGGGFAIGSLFYSDKIALSTAGGRGGRPTHSRETARPAALLDPPCAPGPIA